MDSRALFRYSFIGANHHNIQHESEAEPFFNKALQPEPFKKILEAGAVF